MRRPNAWKPDIRVSSMGFWADTIHLETTNFNTSESMPAGLSSVDQSGTDVEAHSTEEKDMIISNGGSENTNHAAP